MLEDYTEKLCKTIDRASAMDPQNDAVKRPATDKEAGQDSNDQMTLSNELNSRGLWRDDCAAPWRSK